MEKVMNREDQKRAPIYEALEKFRKQRVVPFDVPGHKRGRGNPELVELLGEKCVGIDVNSMKPLDNLCHPVSVIRDAEELAADAFHENDLVINVTKSKKLTNMRASGSDDKARIIPPVIFSLEEALEYIKEDEYVEVTPKSMRMRKVILDELERKRANRG